CFIPYNTDRIVQDTMSSGNAIPTSTGMRGGYPGITNIFRFVRRSDVLARLNARRMVEDIAEIVGEETTLQLRQENFEQHTDAVYAGVWSAAGGFGGSMQRYPRAVFEDWQNTAVTAKAAREIYDVVIDES